MTAITLFNSLETGVALVKTEEVFEFVEFVELFEFIGFIGFLGFVESVECSPGQ